jgi:hypothetical protein
VRRCRQAHCAHAKVLNAPHRSCGYKTGYCRYCRRPRYSRPHPHHPQTVTPGTPQDPTLARLPLLACLKLPTSKQRVSPSPEATTCRVPQPVGYLLTRAGKTHGMPGSQPAREWVWVPHRIPAGLPMPMPSPRCNSIRNCSCFIDVKINFYRILLLNLKVPIVLRAVSLPFLSKSMPYFDSV